MKPFLFISKLDWALTAPALLLAGFGLLSLYSSSLGRGDFLNFRKQLIFLGIGIFLMFLFYFFDYRILKDDPYLILILYFLCILALFGLFFFAPEIRGVKSWYRLGPLSLDPIEFIKIILIFLLAKYFSMRHTELYRIRHIIFSGFYALFPAFLIYLQPNLGSVLILVILWLSVLVLSGIRIRTFFIMMACGILVLSLGWSFLLKDYQKERIMSFIAPGIDPLGTSWSQTQAKIAVGSGGIFGRGFGKGSQTQYGFLPESHTDFIFAAIAEEFGLIGVSALLFLFSILIWRIMKIALGAQTNFSRLFVSGIAVVLSSQIFINVGMNLGLLPVIGIPLPLISYGGSSLIVTLAGLGIIQRIKTGIR